MKTSRVWRASCSFQGSLLQPSMSM
jgi:hypothetical protein